MKTYFYSITYPRSRHSDGEVVSGLTYAVDAKQAFKNVQYEASGASAERMYGTLDHRPPAGLVTAFNYVEDVK